MSTDHILPESRMRVVVGSVRSDGGTMIPIFCANCGKKWGMVPEKHITFAFALCEPCAEKHGDVAHTYKEPDAVFWERIENAQREEHGRLLTVEEIRREIDAGTTPLARLAQEWQDHVSRTGR